MLNLLSKLFNKKKKYEFEPYFYLDMFNNPTIKQTNKFFKLNKVIIHEYSKNKALEKAFLFLNTNYPHLKGKINI